MWISFCLPLNWIRVPAIDLVDWCFRTFKEYQLVNKFNQLRKWFNRKFWAPDQCILKHNQNLRAVQLSIMAELLFEASLTSGLSSLPLGYTFRPLSRNDGDSGHLETLQDLAFVGKVSPEQFVEQFDYMKSCPKTYFVLVIEHDAKVIGTGTLLVERKL